MAGIEKIIQLVENRWLDELFTLSKQSFSTVNVPSHDHLHHLRVWELAKELLIELSENGLAFNEHEIQNLIIAIFFHDLGMINTIDKKHGRESRKLCEAYFAADARIDAKDFSVICDAVERHDDKEYKSMVYSGEAQRDIFSILCVCDDLDAFGAIGVFRYLEIYLLRKTPILELAPTLLQNVASRYSNFTKLYGHLTGFYQKQTKKYNFIHSWFIKLNDELLQGSCTESKTGTIGILNHLVKDLIKGSKTTQTISDYVLELTSDPEVTIFFETFKEEISA